MQTVSEVRHETPQDVVRAQNRRRVLSATAVTGDRVRNSGDEDLGKIEEIMIDLDSGRVAYAVLSFGGFLGIGDKLFAVPWEAFTVNTEEHEFVLNVDKKVLENAPGFDKDNWPDMADPTWGSEIHQHYGTKPAWNSDFTDAKDYMGDDRVDQPNRDRDFEAGGTQYRPKDSSYSDLDKENSAMPISNKQETAPSGHTHYICAGCGDHFHSQAELGQHEQTCSLVKNRFSGSPK